MQRRQVQQQRAGQVIVTVCAILLGVAVAYVFLSAGPFKAPAGGESIELASGTTARAHLLGTSGGGRTATRARTVGGGSGEEDAWFKKLSSSGCKNTEELRVCSHRAKSTEFPDIFPGSLGAYSALWKAKVKCVRGARCGAAMHSPLCAGALQPLWAAGKCQHAGPPPPPQLLLRIDT